jgi:hypothetical protein
MQRTNRAAALDTSFVWDDIGSQINVYCLKFREFSLFSNGKSSNIIENI